jgi:hypothetical protein
MLKSTILREMGEMLGFIKINDVNAPICKLQRISPALIVHHATQCRETRKDGECNDGALARQAADELRQPAAK